MPVGNPVCQSSGMPPEGVPLSGANADGSLNPKLRFFKESGRRLARFS